MRRRKGRRAALVPILSDNDWHSPVPLYRDRYILPFVGYRRCLSTTSARQLRCTESTDSAARTVGIIVGLKLTDRVRFDACAYASYSTPPPSQPHPFNCRFLPTALAREVMQSPPSVRPSVSFHSIFGSDWPLTLNDCVWVVLEHISQRIEDQGHRSKSWVRLMRSIRPRSRAVSLVYPRDAILAPRYIVASVRCLCVCVSVTSRRSIKTAGQIDRADFDKKA